MQNKEADFSKEKSLFFPRGKKGAEMTIGTIIFIVLGVLVLVFLIWGFSSGWSNLWSKITSYTGGGANVDTVKSACALACSSQSVYDWCYNMRTVKFSGGETKKGSCETLGSVGVDACSKVSSQCKDDELPKDCTSLDIKKSDGALLGKGEWVTLKSPDKRGDDTVSKSGIKCKDAVDKTSIALDSDKNKGKKCCVKEKYP